MTVSESDAEVFEAGTLLCSWKIRQLDRTTASGMAAEECMVITFTDSG